MERAIGEAIGQVDVEIAGLRALITDLRPAVLDSGTEAAVTALAERLARDGLEVEVTVDLACEQGRIGGRHLPELEVAMYRIVQEALTNASRHGHARRAVVELLEDDTCVRIRVCDDGGGFDATGGTDGFGLIGMRERAQLLGGTITVESAPDRGTTVCAVFPARSARRPAPQPPIRWRSRRTTTAPAGSEERRRGSRRPETIPGRRPAAIPPPSAVGPIAHV